jgi:uncharacterized integral membrane protein
MRWIRRGAAISLFLLLLVGGWGLAGRNLAPVEIDYLLGTTPPLQLWKVLLAATGLGAGATLLPLTFSRLRIRLELRRYRKELARLEAELKQLRPPAAVLEAGGDEPGHD